jgi:hypothetical protein
LHPVFGIRLGDLFDKRIGWAPCQLWRRGTQFGCCRLHHNSAGVSKHRQATLPKWWTSQLEGCWVAPCWDGLGT